MSMDIELLLEEKIFSYNPIFDEEYRAERSYHFIVVGAGGTGGYLIPNLARMVGIKNKDGRDHKITIVDKDDVEEKNLLRQNFSPNDIGKNKAEVMATRYGRAFGETIYYLDEYIESASRITDLITEENRVTVIIDAVDNNKTRFILKQGIEDYHAKTNHQGRDTLMISSGNEEHAGQVVFSYTTGLFEDEYIQEGYRTSSPDIVDIFPTMNIGQLPDEESCAERAVSAPQNISTNITAADIIFGFVNKLLNGITIDSLVYFFDSQTMTRKAYSGRTTHVKELLSKVENNAKLYDFFVDEITNSPGEDALVYPPSYEEVINSNQEAEQAIVDNAQEQEEIEERMNQAIEEAENIEELNIEEVSEQITSRMYSTYLLNTTDGQDTLSYDRFVSKIEDEYHDHKVAYGMLHHDDDEVQADNQAIVSTEAVFAPTGPATSEIREGQEQVALTSMYAQYTVNLTDTDETLSYEQFLDKLERDYNEHREETNPYGPGPVGPRGTRGGTQEEYEYFTRMVEEAGNTEYIAQEIKALRILYDGHILATDRDDRLSIADFVDTLEESYSRHKMSVGMLTHLIDTNEEDIEEEVEQSNLFTDEEFDSFLALNRLDELDTFEDSGLFINDFDCFLEPFTNIDGTRMNNLKYRLAKRISILKHSARTNPSDDSDDTIRMTEEIDYLLDIQIMLEDEVVTTDEDVYQKDGSIYVNDVEMFTRYEILNTLGEQDWLNPVWPRDYLIINMDESTDEYQWAQRLIDLRVEMSLTFNQTAFITELSPRYYLRMEYGHKSIEGDIYELAIHKLIKVRNSIGGFDSSSDDGESESNDIVDEINKSEDDIRIDTENTEMDAPAGDLFESNEDLPEINNVLDCDVRDALDKMADIEIEIDYEVESSIVGDTYSEEEVLDLKDLYDDLRHISHRIHLEYMKDDTIEFSLNDEGFTILNDTIMYRGDIRDFIEKADKHELSDTEENEEVRPTPVYTFADDISELSVIYLANKLNHLSDVFEAAGNEYEENTVFLAGEEMNAYDAHNELEEIVSSLKSVKRENEDKGFSLVGGVTFLYNEPIYPGDIRDLLDTSHNHETEQPLVLHGSIENIDVERFIEETLKLEKHFEDLTNKESRRIVWLAGEEMKDYEAYDKMQRLNDILIDANRNYPDDKFFFAYNRTSLGGKNVYAGDIRNVLKERDTEDFLDLDDRTREQSIGLGLEFDTSVAVGAEGVYLELIKMKEHIHNHYTSTQVAHDWPADAPERFINMRLIKIEEMIDVLGKLSKLNSLNELIIRDEKTYVRITHTENELIYDEDIRNLINFEEINGVIEDHEESISHN